MDENRNIGQSDYSATTPPLPALTQLVSDVFDIRLFCQILAGSKGECGHG